MSSNVQPKISGNMRVSSAVQMKCWGGGLVKNEKYMCVLSTDKDGETWAELFHLFISKLQV